MILAGRETNDSAASFIAGKAIKLLMSGPGVYDKPVINILGFTFKENCPDVRNTQVIKIIRVLEDYGCLVKVCDPIANKREARDGHGVELVEWSQLHEADALIYAVPHQQFESMQEVTIDKVKTNGIILDVKSRLQPSAVGSNQLLWRF